MGLMNAQEAPEVKEAREYFDTIEENLQKTVEELNRKIERADDKQKINDLKHEIDIAKEKAARNKQSTIDKIEKLSRTAAGAGKAASGIGTMIMYIIGGYIIYTVYKGSSLNSASLQSTGWKPLTQQELERMKVWQ